MNMEKQYTYDERIVSDLYKEAYGSRPRADFWAKWDKGTALNGCSREDAIRHLHQTYETDGDTEYLEYHLGVRYGYLSGKVNSLYV
jgi:hypothetical protein